LTPVKNRHVVLKCSLYVKNVVNQIWPVLKAEIARDTSRDFDYAILELATL